MASSAILLVNWFYTAVNTSTTINIQFWQYKREPAALGQSFFFEKYERKKLELFASNRQNDFGNFSPSWIEKIKFPFLAMGEMGEGKIWETIKNGNEKELEQKIEKGLKQIRKYNTTGVK